jgi:TolB-like protein
VASVWAELRRRNVVKVAMLYVVASWLTLQVADVLFENLGAPDWAFELVLGMLLLFFLPALIFAWAFEITPEGLKRESEIDRARSNTRETGRRLNLITIIIVVIGVGILLADRLFPGAGDDFRKEKKPVVAALPFAATGSDDGGELAAGLHDELLTLLAKLGVFKVISRTSVMEYADTTRNMREIGRELGADFILEGSVQARGGKVRVNAQLIDATADEHIWAEIYDRDLDAINLFDIQANLAIAIARELEIELNVAEQSVVKELPTENTAAYNAYLRGLNLQHSVSFAASKDRRIERAFEEAAKLDPEFGLAWARLSRERSYITQSERTPEIREAALVALARARALRPDLQETELAWVAYLYYGSQLYQEALAALEAIGERFTLDAESLAMKAYLYRRVGDFGAAYKTLLAAEERNPRSEEVLNFLVTTAILGGDCEAAGSHALKLMALAPDVPEARSTAAWYEMQCTGDAARASELLANLDYEGNWQLWNARIAARVERDFEKALALADIPLPQSFPLDALHTRNYRALVFQQAGRHEDFDTALAIAGETISGLPDSGKIVNSEAYAAAMLLYEAMRGDVEATRYWVTEHGKRSNEETRGDMMAASEDRLFHARALAIAGLHDEALQNLRIMLEGPGGNTFRFVESLPDFDVLRQHPEYELLREQFGNSDQI